MINNRGGIQFKKNSPRHLQNIYSCKLRDRQQLAEAVPPAFGHVLGGVVGAPRLVTAASVAAGKQVI
jgi:hypothetical protein